MGRLKVIAIAVAVPAILLASFGVGLAMSGSDDILSTYHPVFVEVTGDVQILGTVEGVWETAAAGVLLLSGDTVKTGEDGRARIQFESGVMDIYETTVLVIPSIGDRSRRKDIREVEIESGGVKFDINKQGVRRRFEFRTRHIQGGVKGTRFTVQSDEETTTVAVYEGEVQVSDPSSDKGLNASLIRGHSVSSVRGKGLGLTVRFNVPDDFNAIHPGKGLGLERTPPGLNMDSSSPGQSGDAPGQNK